MQVHVSESLDSKDNSPTRSARKSWIQKVLFTVGSALNDREPGPVSDQIFRGTSSSRASFQRDELQHFMNW
jgi:hypothetical protein